MENASKALLMAGGILIALLVIGALMLMVNQLSSYQTSKSGMEVVDSISEYNLAFTRFDNDKIKGYELITLMNKVIDNNNKDGIVDDINYSDDYDVMINITLGKDFWEKYGINKDESIFNKDKEKAKYENIKDKSNRFYKIIKNFYELEAIYTLKVMNNLSANYDSIKTYEELKKEGKNEAEIKQENGKSIKEVVGKDINITLNQIAEYREYSDFKISTFKLNKIEYYKNGQIKSLTFEFLK